MAAASGFDVLAASAVVIVGAPRSGTSWLGKIFDSHPNVLYRFEPDWFDPEEVATDASVIRGSLSRWIRNRDLRAAGRRPLFAKSWQTRTAHSLRVPLIYAAAAAGRIGLPVWPIPDLGDTARTRAVVKSIRLRDGIGAFTEACPEGQGVVIIRHPCAQAASLMRGARDGRFEPTKPESDMPYDEARTIAFAARHGTNEKSFRRLRDAAKYAWSWREFNETALGSIANRTNARIVVYEQLCARPLEEAKALLSFTGLSWNAQTERFIARSTSYRGHGGYYAVLRNSVDASERWRSTLSPEDQSAVRAIVRNSTLVQYWPDLTT